MPSDSSYSIADVRALLSQRVGLELSPIELAEILWLALQRGEIVANELEARRSPNPPSPRDQQEPERCSSSASATESEPATAQPDSESVAVVADPPKTAGEEKGEGSDQPAGPALPVNIPEAVALRNRQAIARSLRPLMRKVASEQRQAIDEEATVIQIAETQTWSPIMQPEPERWLELAIVIEVTNVLDVWWDTIAEFQQLMERHGAFRTVRTWQLKPNAAGDPQLFLQTAAGLRSRARSPRELLDSAGRRLILLLSDCTSRAWRSGKIPQLLELWSRENPVTIVQLLPESYWDRSALGSGYPVALRSRLPGALSRDWVIDGLSPRRRQRLPEGLKLPVVTMQPESFRQWARAIAAMDEQRTTGIVLNPQVFPTQTATAQAATLTAKQLVQRFRNTASAKAQELADMMAVLPVNWSVIQLIQKNLLPDIAELWQPTGALYLAEVFLSGLLRPEPLTTNLSLKHQITPQYDFVEGVREVLLGTVPISEAQAVGEEVAEAVFKQLPLEVQDRVNADITRRFGDSLSYFEAFLIPDLPWGDAAATEIFPFARVTRQVLQRWGGAYAALAEELTRSLSIHPRGEAEASIPVPVLQEFEFEVATIEFPASQGRLSGIDLRLVEVEVATITGVSQLERLELEEALQIFERAIFSQTGKYPAWLQTEIFREVWSGITYEEIALRTNYSVEHIKNNGARLWKLLSKELGQKVVKSNVKKVLSAVVGNQVKIHYARRQIEQFVEDLGNGTVLEMVAISAGEFVMGSPENELERSHVESPQHPVNVSSFFMGQYPVTQAQWSAIAALPQVNRSIAPPPYRYKGSDCPVEDVSWWDAVEFCDRLSQFTGKRYRLPSEAEWEYACRAGTTTPFHFGETITTDLANYDGKYTYWNGPQGVDRRGTTPVGSFGVANAFGLYDMHGNVWEWCADHWHGNYEGAPDNGSAWLSENDDARRLLRGGSWGSYPRRCRSAYRHISTPDDRFGNRGFRVVCSA